ncbi:MAG: plastocyanin/azurin family copper-binding protein [Chloroflexales bacterium]|nr:plastocyanin/azurin family copper-binding protein [Chloroflexales bacterium]
MNKMVRIWTIGIVAVLSLILTACGGGGAADGGGEPSTDGGGSANLELTADEITFEYDKTSLTATAGQEVTLTLNNPAAIEHNWVLVNGGEDVAQAVNDAGIVVGVDAGYIPEDQSQIIAFTELAQPGDSASVTFTAPAAGTYMYLCTVPGHFVTMKGTLTVNP